MRLAYAILLAAIAVGTLTHGYNRAMAEINSTPGVWYD
ncbi:hypothetical protein P67b_00065 [Ruegeria phage Tedan]|nr:hypothetical protein P67b_00065 [Ruegeria phage Tedan]